MASPFRIFRKYQKTLLVVAGVILMFVFVIGDALVGYLGGSRRGGGDFGRDAGATAVRWDGGSLTNSELQDLVLRRRIVKAFVLGVWAAGEQSALQAGVEPRPLRVDPIFRPDTPETPQQGVERSVVQTRLFAEAARDVGMRVSDDTIIQYLDELGRGNVSRDDMRAMLSRLQSGNWHVSIDYVIDALREEMLGHNYVASHQFAFDTVTPQQRWEDWLQVNDRVVIEAAAIPVERFVAEVPEPTEAELVAFFDKNKNREPQPDFVGQMEFPSPTPGFRIPRKIDVQFIQASYDQYLAKIEKGITDEEIEQYYNEHKDPEFIKADTSLFDEPGEDQDAASDRTEEPESPATETPSETPPADETEAPRTEDTSTEPDSSTESAEAAEVDQPGETTPPATVEENAPSEKADTDADTDNESAPVDSDQSSRGDALRGRIRLAAFLQEAESESAPGDESDPDASAAEAAEDTAADTAPPASETADSTVADSSAATEAWNPKAETAAATPPAEEKPKQFQPLDEVRDLIRRELAGRRAAEELAERINKLASQLNAEFNSYFAQVLDAQAEERDLPAPPAALADLEPLAKEHGLEHGKTGLVSLFELRDTAIGKSGSGETGVALWRTLFGSRDLELYQPLTTVDIDGNRYIAMKTSDTPDRVPEFAEVKDDVLRAWKQQRAAELALKHAEEEAKKAKESGSMLADYFSAQESIEVLRTDPFSQYTGGDVAFVGGEFQQQPFRLSEPDGVVAAGPEFLQRVFELKDGEVAAVLNHDHSIAYVIRLVEHQDSQDELRSAYLAEANNWPGLRLMIGSHARVAAASLVSDIVKDAGLEWERPNDQVEQDEEEAG